MSDNDDFLNCHWLFIYMDSYSYCLQARISNVAFSKNYYGSSYSHGQYYTKMPQMTFQLLNP